MVEVRNLLALMGWTSLVLLLVCTVSVRGQMPSPFEGQGAIPPPTGGSGSVPVYTSASLQKLLYVDDTTYQFEVIVDIMLSWTDPRAASIFNGSSVYVQSQSDAQNSTLAACLTSPANSSNSCQSGTVGPYTSSSCNRLCAPGVSYLCCDALWLPTVDLKNVLYQPQDRYIYYRITPVGQAVTWLVRITGIFTSPLSFERFPFDKQNLQLRFVARDPSTVRLFASQLQKSGASSDYSNLGGARADELPNWVVTDMWWGPEAVEVSDYTDVAIFKPASEADPLFAATKKSTVDASTKYQGSGQSLVIHISRQADFYFWNMVFPVLICVTLSWVAFFVHPLDLGVRLGSSVTLLLTITAIQFLVGGRLPAASYLTAFHKVLLVSYLFISFAVLESLLVYYLTGLKGKREKRGKSVAREESPDFRNLQPAESLSPELKSLKSVVSSEMHKYDAKDDLSMMSRIQKWREGQCTWPEVFNKDHKRAAVDEAWAFRRAGALDRLCIVIFPLTYYLSVILLFAVSGHSA